MTEEKKEVVEEVKEVVAEVVAEPSPTELQARDQGWVSKDEWVATGKSEDEWRPAKEFVDRGELFKSIHTTKRELKQLQTQHTALQKHHQYIFDKARKTALDDLKKERRAAMIEGDPTKVEDIEEQIEETQQQFAEERQQLVAAQAAENPSPPEFETWKEKNVWYNNDEDMHDYADAAGLIYIQRNPSAKPAEVLRHVDQKMKKQFPAQFETKKVAQSPALGSDKTIRASKKSDGFEMDEMELDIMKTTVASGVITKEQFIAELKKAKGIK
jgi:hypothetical protein